MPGTRNNVNPLVRPELDLDALLSQHSLDPKPIRLGGKTYQIRRDLTGVEVTEYWKLVRDGKDVEALGLIASAPAMLNKALERLPYEHMKLALQKIMEAAGLVIAGGDSGE